MTHCARKPLLVLFPGLDGTGKLFSRFQESLGEVDTHVIRYPTAEPLGYEALELLARASLPKDRPFVLLGESFGGPIAIRIAADPPTELVGLILCGTFAQSPYTWIGPARHLAAWLPVKSLPRWLRAPLMWGSSKSKHAPAQAVRAMADVAAPVLRRRIAALLSVDACAAARRIALPSLILTASRDRVIPRAATRRLLELIGEAEVHPIDGPHLLLQACPEACASRVLEFLARCP